MGENAARYDVELDARSFTTALNACARGQKWCKALALLQDMPRHGVEPEAECFNVTFRACESANQWNEARRVMGYMQDFCRARVHGIQPFPRGATENFTRSTPAPPRKQEPPAFAPSAYWTEVRPKESAPFPRPQDEFTLFHRCVHSRYGRV